jgi:isopentenyldiphosphate isomerase
MVDNYNYILSIINSVKYPIKSPLVFINNNGQLINAEVCEIYFFEGEVTYWVYSEELKEIYYILSEQIIQYHPK